MSCIDFDHIVELYRTIISEFSEISLPMNLCSFFLYWSLLLTKSHKGSIMLRLDYLAGQESDGIWY